MNYNVKKSSFLLVITAMVYVGVLGILMMKEQIALALVWGVAGIVILFIFIGLIKRNGIASKHLFIAMFILIIIQATLFAFFSFLDYKRYIGPAQYTTRYDYFVSQYNMNNPMTFVEFRSYSLTVGYDIFANKDIYIDESLAEDEIVGYLLRGLNKELTIVNSMTVEEDLLLEVRKCCQTFYFYSENSKVQDCRLYLSGNMNWKEENNIYFFRENNDIYIIFGDEGINIGENKQISLWINADSQSRYEWVKVDWGNNTGYEILSVEMIGKATIIGRNLIYVLYIFLLGVFAGFSVRKLVGNSTYVFMSFPLGTIVQIIGSVIIGIVKIPYTLFSLCIATGCTALLFLLIFSHLLRNIPKRNEKFPFFETCITLAIISLFSFIPNIFTSYDSFMYNYLSHYIVFNGEFHSILGELSSFTFATPIINIGAFLFKVDLLYSFQPIHTLLGLLCIWNIQKSLLQFQGVDKRGSRVIASLSMGVYMSMPVFWAFTDWINNNIIIGIWLGIAGSLIALTLYVKDEKIKITLFYLGYPFFLLGNIIRIEGLLFGCIMLITIYVLRVSRRVLGVYSMITFLIATGEFFLFCKTIGFRKSEFWTVEKGAAMLTLFLVVSFVLLTDFIWKGKLKILFKYVDYIMMGVLLLAAIVLTAVKFKLGINNIIVMGTQWFIMGYFGVFWLIFLFILALVKQSWQKQNQLYRFTLVFSLSSVLMIFLLSFFKSPLHIGAGDSACRMVLHIIPILGLAISSAIGELYKRKNTP